MRQFTLILLAGFLQLSGSALAQSKLYLSPRLGYGTFQMTLMKELQQNVVRDTQVNAQVTESFSPYLQFGLGMASDLNEHIRVGTFLERGSTGGRVSYEDYSGEVRVDNLVNYTALGLQLSSRKLIGTSQLSLLGGLELNGFISRLHIDSYFRLYEDATNNTHDFNSFGLGAKPHLGLLHPVLGMPVELTVGYLASINGPFHLPGQQDRYLTLNHSGTKLKPDWSGLRLNLSVAIPIIK